MKRYIKTIYYMSFFFVTVILVIASFALFTHLQTASIRNNLYTTAEIISHFTIPENTDYNQLAYDIGSTDGNLRITIIDTDGNILGDSNANYADMENHLTRNEIADVLSDGLGEDIRISKTMGFKTIYIAKKINDTTIFRFAYELSGAYDYLFTMIPIIIVLCVIIMIVIHILANHFTDKLLSPLYHINTLLEGSADDSSPVNSFSDIEPIITNINYLVNKLNYDLSEIQKTQKMRTDFIANVSHELKSPLTSVKGFAELLYSDMVSEDKKSDYLYRIINESDRLLEVINDIIKLSEAETVKENETETLNLRQISLEVANALESQADKKGISINVIGEGHIIANQSDIWAIIYNLADNAIKYGKLNGYVRIELTEFENTLHLTVSDNGIGIPKEQQARVFERFYRVDKSHSRKNGGTGLGLSIVKNVSARYGALVTVSSEPNKGSSFKIDFPISEGT